MQITWLGHGSFAFRLPSGEVLAVDPWINGNPSYPASHSFDRIDTLLLTHAHFDHAGDVVSLAKQFTPRVGAIYELATWLGGQGVLNATGFNKGGTVAFGEVKATMTHALHSSSIIVDGQIIYGGEPCGYVLHLPDGRRIYFAGDTTVFSDMALIAELYEPDLCILPIGDVYTMGPREAAVACRLLKAKQVIGMHYGTFPPLTGRPARLAELVKPLGCEVIELEPGVALEW